jgi:DNA-binding PadR family transcriptional regulator
MREPTFLILTSLAAGPQHGYGIMTDVRQIFDGRTWLAAETARRANVAVAAARLRLAGS